MDESKMFKLKNSLSPTETTANAMDLVAESEKTRAIIQGYLDSARTHYNLIMESLESQKRIREALEILDKKERKGAAYSEIEEQGFVCKRREDEEGYAIYRKAAQTMLDQANYFEKLLSSKEYLHMSDIEGSDKI